MFWNKIKDLFSPKKKVIHQYAASYSTFAGCDCRFVLLPHKDNWSARDYFRASRFITERIVIGEVQSISMIKEFATLRVSGDLTTLLFTESALSKIPQGGDWDLVIRANNETEACVMVLSKFRVTNYKWDIDIDDLCSEETFHWEADKCIYWTPIDLYKGWDQVGQIKNSQEVPTISSDTKSDSE